MHISHSGGLSLVLSPPTKSLADQAVEDAQCVCLIGLHELLLSKILEVRRIANIGDGSVPERLSEFREMRMDILDRMAARRLAAS